MWREQATPLQHQRGYTLRFNAGGEDLSRGRVVDLLADSSDFRDFFVGVLRRRPYRVFRWETPPLYPAGMELPFECAVIDSPAIDLPADRGPFGAQFATRPPGGICEFDNLGGDARMVVPCPVDDTTGYSHIGAFLDTAPAAQQHALWSVVAAAARRLAGGNPRWLNTAGGGVAWLHIRLDARPKYYVYAPYRRSQA